jgi:Mycobacterium membrane protein
MVEPGVRYVEEVPFDGAAAGRGDAVVRPASQPSPEPAARDGSGRNRRNRRFTISRVLKRLWMPLVVLVVIAAGGFTVSRLHGVFGSEKRVSYADTRVDDSRPFDPKHLKYEVFGPPGTVADISYFDANGDLQFVQGASLPWSVEFPITAATAGGNVAAQGDSDSLGCRITVDGVVKTEKTANEVHAFAFCLLKAA